MGALGAGQSLFTNIIMALCFFSPVICVIGIVLYRIWSSVAVCPARQLNNNYNSACRDYNKTLTALRNDKLTDYISKLKDMVNFEQQELAKAKRKLSEMDRLKHSRK